VERRSPAVCKVSDHTYSFAGDTAALRIKVEDLRPKGAGWQVQLHEKVGKQHAMPCHHALPETLRANIDAAGIADNRKGWLFRTGPGHNAIALADSPMSQADAWRSAGELRDRLTQDEVERIRTHRFANWLPQFRPFAAFQDRPCERAVRARKRTSAKRMGCANTRRFASV
jgi:hypothetical protein